MENDILRVAAVVSSPLLEECAFKYNSVAQINHKLCNPGLSIEALQYVMTGKQLILGRYHSFGLSGKTNGSMTKAIVDQDCHISPPYLYQNSERGKVTTYMYPAFMKSEHEFLVNPARSTQSLPLFAPFDGTVWSLGLLTYLMSTVCLSCLMDSKAPMIERISKSLYQLPFMQKKRDILKTSSEKILVTTWSSLARLMIIVYAVYFIKGIIPESTGKLASQFGTMDKIATKLQNGYKLVVIMPSSYVDIFVNHSNLNVRKQFPQQFDLAPYSKSKTRSYKDLANYTLHNEGRILVSPVGIVTSLKSRLMVPNDASFVVVPKGMPSESYFMVTTKNYFTKNETKTLYESTMNLRRYGIMEKLKKHYRLDYSFLDTQLSWKTPNYRAPVDFALLLKFSYILFVGYAFSITGIFVEKIWWH